MRTSVASDVVQLTPGVTTTLDIDVVNIYDDDIAQKRYEAVNSQFRKEIESVAEQLKKK